MNGHSRSAQQRRGGGRQQPPAKFHPHAAELRYADAAMLTSPARLATCLVAKGLPCLSRWGGSSGCLVDARSIGGTEFCIMTAEHALRRPSTRTRITFNYERDRSASEWIEVGLDVDDFWIHEKDGEAGMDYCLVAVARADYNKLRCARIKPLPLAAAAAAGQKTLVGTKVEIWQHPSSHESLPLGGGFKMVSCGEISAEEGGRLLYQITTRRFSSGSPVVRANDGAVLGIHCGKKSKDTKMATSLPAILLRRRALESEGRGGGAPSRTEAVLHVGRRRCSKSPPPRERGRDGTVDAAAATFIAAARRIAMWGWCLGVWAVWACCLADGVRSRHLVAALVPALLGGGLCVGPYLVWSLLSPCKVEQGYRVVHDCKRLDRLFSGRVAALTLWPCVFFTPGSEKGSQGADTLRHEAVHLVQQQESLVLPFHVLYAALLLGRLALWGMGYVRAPYKCLCFEHEAYAHEKRPAKQAWQFLRKGRKRFDFLDVRCAGCAACQPEEE